LLGQKIAATQQQMVDKRISQKRAVRKLCQITNIKSIFFRANIA